MNSHPLVLSFQKSLKILTFQNKSLNPLLFMYFGITLTQSFSSSYMLSLWPDDIFVHLCIFLAFSPLYFIALLGIEIEITKSVIRLHIPSYNILRLIFKRMTLRYLWIRCIFFIVLFIIYFIIYLSFFFILNNFSIENYLSELIQEDSIKDSFYIYFSIFSSIIITPFVYIFIQIIDHKPLSLKESVQKTKGHFIHIGSMNFLHSIFYCGLIFFRRQDFFSQSLGVECGIDMIFDCINLLYIVILSYYIRDYVEKAPVNNELN